jgi:3,4-dihydroxy 2-butanone 4-phosphate synthase/GTP cyclohydrolase II
VSPEGVHSAGEPTPVESALAALAAGRAVVVADEHQGQLVMAADAVDTDAVAFFLAHTAGLIGVALPAQRLDELGIPLMVEHAVGDAVALSVSVDAVGAGVSAEGRAETIRALADPARERDAFSRPGAVFPLRARPAGVLERPGYTEAAVDLARMAGRAAAAALCAITSEDKRGLASGAELERLGLPVVSISDVVAHRLTHERLLTRAARAHLPTRAGDFECFGWQHLVDGSQHVALLRGDLGGDEPVLVAVHTECLAGDVLGSLICDCRARLDEALEQIAAAGRGVCIYVRQPEGRGLRLDHVHDEMPAGAGWLDPEVSAERWEHGIAAQILADLGVRNARLLPSRERR